MTDPGSEPGVSIFPADGGGFYATPYGNGDVRIGNGDTTDITFSSDDFEVLIFAREHIIKKCKETP